MLTLSFGNGITLAYFEHHPTRLFTASDNLDCRYVRAYFKQNGTTATQYVEQNLSNIYETAEDMIAMGNERIAFYVTAANFHLCDRLTAVLKELDDCNQIVWFGEYASIRGEQLMEQTLVDGIVKWEPEATLFTLSNTEPDEWGIIAGFISRNQIEHSAESHSPLLYESNESAQENNELDQFSGIWEEAAQARQTPILTIKCADRLGQHNLSNGLRNHSSKRFTRDLELAIHSASRVVEARLHIEGFQHISNKTTRDGILEVLKESKDRVSYKLEVPLEWMVQEEILNQLQQSGITQIEVRIPLLMTEEQAKEGISLVGSLRNFKTSNERAAISVALVDSANKISAIDAKHTAELLAAWTTEAVIHPNSVKVDTHLLEQERDRIYLPEPIAEYLIRHTTNELQPALTNGYVAYMTGNYPGQSIGGSVKHIGYTEGTWNTSSVHRLGEYSGVNSALLFEYNQVNREENYEKIYADRDGVWKRKNDVFDQLVQTAEQEEYYLSNAHQIVRRDEYEYELQMNDFLQMKPMQVRSMNYLKARQLEPDGDEVEFQFLEISSEDDLDLFLQDVEQFSRNGRFRHGFEIQSYLIDSCRWSSAHYCKAKELPRLFVDSQDQVSSCRGCSAIGDIYDSLDSLLTQVSIMSDQEQILRGCRTCEIKESCSKCSFLPSYMNRQQYCSLRKKHGMLHRYMQMVQLFKGLRKYTQALNGIGIQDIKVSLPTCTHRWPKLSEINNSSSVNETVFLFFVREEPLLFHAASQKILKLNELMALILEGLMTGADEQKLEAYIAEKYQVEKEYAAKSVSQAIEMFAREGCLKIPARTV